MKSERKAPASASFVSVASACDDTLIEAKLKFLVAVAKPLQEFLFKFQTEAPVTPFLTLSSKNFLLAIMGCCFKNKVLEKTDTFKKLSTIDPADKKNQKKTKACWHWLCCLKYIKKVTEKKLQVNYVFYLSKMIALCFCLLL